MLLGEIVSCLHSCFLLLLDQKKSVGSGALLSSKFWELYKHMGQVGLDSPPSIRVVQFSRSYPSEVKGGTMWMHDTLPFFYPKKKGKCAITFCIITINPHYEQCVFALAT